MNAVNDPDFYARQALSRHKLMATSLLGVMACGALAGYALPALGWIKVSLPLEVLRAGAKAGVVGGLADWFAVTALFRRPLGLPIPHTAILPAQKDRIGHALGRFVAGHFLSEEDVIKLVQSLDFPTMLAKFLADPATAQSVVRQFGNLMPSALDRLEDGRAATSIGRVLHSLVSDGEIAPLVARALRALVNNDCHQDVLSFLLDEIKMSLKTRESALRSMIEDRVREQGGRILSWAIGGSIASKVLGAVNVELDRVDPRNSELRDGFTTWAHEEIDRIETDPVRRTDITEAILSVFTHDAMRAWGGDIWSKIRVQLDKDIVSESGWSASLIRELLLKLSDQVATDPAMRQRVMDVLTKLIVRTLPFVRERLSGFMGAIVEKWDSAELSTRLELRVGKDLQFVRLNGTLVGFVAGALLFAVLRLSFGSAAG